ncbi:hypothetical protein EV361DRAFT_952825 [Lentinula raphanica]|nr:hypothetical protein EV361DRAFT_952825 [Lentinula raphanica]
MTFIRGSGSNNSPSSQPFSGTFAHTGLHFGTNNQGNQAPSTSSQDLGSGTASNSNAGAPTPTASGSNQQNHQPDAPNQGSSNSGSGQPGDTGNTESQVQAGEQARKAAEDELKALQRRMAEIQGMLATTDRADKLFVDPSTFEDTQHLSTSYSPAKKTPKVPVLPDIIDGFTASPHSLPLSRAARLKESKGDQEVSISADGSLTVKGLDRRNESNISETQWWAAAKSISERICFYHGARRADAFDKHNDIVWSISVNLNWQVAMEYDITQRELWVANPAHDIHQENHTCLWRLQGHPPNPREILSLSALSEKFWHPQRFSKMPRDAQRL